MKLADAAEERAQRFHELRGIGNRCPDSKLFWQAYCAFIDAEAEFDAAMARVDRANGTWKLRVVK